MCVLSCFSRVQLFETLWTVACQAPLSMEFSKQECWSGLPCSPPEDQRTTSLMSPALAGVFFYHWCYLGSPGYRWSKLISPYKISRFPELSDLL